MFDQIPVDNLIRYIKRYNWYEMKPNEYHYLLTSEDDKGVKDYYFTISQNSSVEEIENAVKVISEAWNTPIFVICSEIYKFEKTPIRYIHVTDSLLEKIIPKGIYCYDENGICPFWEKFDFQFPKQGDGYCHYLEKGDWMRKDGTDLLWDQCKCCGINTNDKNE